MKSGQYFFPSLLGLVIGALLFPGLPSRGEAKNATGVVVESVEPQSVAEQAGVKPGDLFLMWTRSANPPANPIAAKGRIQSAFDWLLLEKDQSPRGTVMLSGTRAGRQVNLTLPQDNWSFHVRPALVSDLVVAYEQGCDLIRKKEKEGISRLLNLAAGLTAKSEWQTACWFRFQCGQLCNQQKWWTEAQTSFQEALQGTENKGRPEFESLIWASLGETFRNMNDYEAAKNAWERALQLSETKIGENLLTAICLDGMGRLASERKDPASANAYQIKALAIREKVAPDSLAVAASLNNLGNAALDQGELAQAEAYFARTLAINEKFNPDSLAVAEILNNLGMVAKKRGELSQADTYLSKALTIREKLAPDSLAVASSLNNLGLMAWSQGDLARAYAYHTQALAIKEKIAPDSLDVAQSLNNLGLVALDRGDLAQAESCHTKALAIKEKITPDSLPVAASLNNLGTVAWSRGDLTQAEIYFTKTMAIIEKLVPGSLVVAGTLNNLGEVAIERGDLVRAETYHAMALAIREKLAPDSFDVTGSLNNLGNVAQHRGDLTQAETYYSKALAIRERLAPNSLSVADIMKNLGMVAHAWADLALAEMYHANALAIEEKLAPGSADEAETLHELGDLSRQQHKQEQALTFLERAVEALEKQKGKWGGGSEAMERFSEKFADYYRELIELKLKLNQKEDAFNVLERFRARTFLNLLAERDLDFTKDAPAELLREQKRTDFAYDRVQKELGDVSEGNEPEKVKDLLEQLQTLRTTQNDIAQQIRQASPHLASLQYPEPLTWEQAKNLFPPDQAFLSYCVGLNSTSLFVTFGGKLAVYAIPVSRERLEREVRSFRTIQESAGISPQLIRKKGFELYSLLLKPAEKQLRPTRSLVICPDGPLHLLTFAALCNDRKHYLVEEKTVSYVLSATVYAETRRASQTGKEEITLAAFGDPVYRSATGETFNAVVRSLTRRHELIALPATRHEVESICKVYGENQPTVLKYLGEEAREETAKRLKGHIALVHFACHGLLDQRFPLDSGLALTIPESQVEGEDNGILQAWEIFESVRFNADLVTLSACQSGIGEVMGGEGMIGLTRAFQYAGAHSVLASLWSVADEPTAVFMKRFYTYLRQGKQKAESLRQAQLDFIHSPQEINKDLPAGKIEVAHPFYWAPFVLNGD